jgi:hypothetical protein
VSSSGELSGDAIGDLAEREDGIDATGLDRGDWHTRNDGRFPILRESGCARVSHGPQATRAVAPHAGQHDANGARAVHLRNGAE